MYAIYYQPYWTQPDELEHFGIKGMKWGIRRYQNPDGTLTEAGKKRLDTYKIKEYNKLNKVATRYRSSVEKKRFKNEQKGKVINPKKLKKQEELLSRFDKELKAIKTTKLSDMQAEKIASGKQFQKLFIAQMIGGIPATVLVQAIGIVESPQLRVSNMRIKRYDEEHKSK